MSSIVVVRDLPAELGTPPGRVPPFFISEHCCSVLYLPNSASLSAFSSGIRLTSANTDRKIEAIISRQGEPPGHTQDFLVQIPIRYNGEESRQ
jgi:hypothetical protein